MILENGFDIISKTGSCYYLLTHLSECDCVSGDKKPFDPDLKTVVDVDNKLKNELLLFCDNFKNLTFKNDVFCKKCYSQGSVFKPIKTEPLRAVPVSSKFTNQNILTPDFVYLNDKSYVIYLDSKYEHVTFNDFICTFKVVDSKDVFSSVFKIVGKEIREYENFKYIELTVINISSHLENVGVFDYVKTTKL